MQRWAAEQQNDAGPREGLLAEGFAGVGPLGFALTREQRLARFGNGLVNRSFTIEDPQVRSYGTAAVVIGGSVPGDELAGPRQLRPVPGHASDRAFARPMAARQRSRRPVADPRRPVTARVRRAKQNHKAASITRSAGCRPGGEPGA